MRYLLPVAAIILSAWLTPPALAADRDLDECDNAKDTNRAIAACTRVIESGRGDIARAYFIRGLKYGARKRAFDRAISDLTAAIRLDPKEEFYYLARGDSYKWKGDYARAIADYSEAIRRTKTAPRFSLFHRIRGCGYFASGEYDNAIADFSTVIGHKLVTEDSKAWSYEARSRTYKAKGDHALALSDHKEAIRIEPGVAAKDVCPTRP